MYVGAHWITRPRTISPPFRFLRRDYRLRTARSPVAVEPVTLQRWSSALPFRLELSISRTSRRSRRTINMGAIVGPNLVTQQRVCMHDMQIFVGSGVYRGLWVLRSLSSSPSLSPWTRGSGSNHKALRSAFYNLGHRIRPMYVPPLCATFQLLMVMRKGHNVVVPWSGHDLFWPQPQTQGGCHLWSVALSLF